MSFLIKRRAGSFNGSFSGSFRNLTSMEPRGPATYEERSRLPSPEEGPFKEGYVGRRVPATFKLSRNTWARRFMILQAGELSIHYDWDSVTDDSTPLERIRVNHLTRIESATHRYKTPLCVVIGEQGTDESEYLVLAFSTEEDQNAWCFAIRSEIARQVGSEVRFPPVRSRFMEGPMFKTPPGAGRWEERYFELTGDGILTYWSSKSGSKRGTIPLETCKVIPNATEAPGVPTNFFFQIHTFVKVSTDSGAGFMRRIYNLSAPGESAYIKWLKALRVWVGTRVPEPAPPAEFTHDLVLLPSPGSITRLLPANEGAGRSTTAVAAATQENAVPEFEEFDMAAVIRASEEEVRARSAEAELAARSSAAGEEGKQEERVEEEIPDAFPGQPEP